MKIKDALLKATGMKDKKQNETDAKFRARLVSAANDMDEDDFKALPDECQEWVNDGIAAMNAKKDVADFPADDDDDEKGDEGEEGDDEKPAEKPAKATKTPEKPKPAEKSAKAEGDVKKKGASKKFKELQITNPSLKQGEVLDLLIAEGYSLTPSSAGVIYYETKQVLEVLAEMKLLKKLA